MYLITTEDGIVIDPDVVDQVEIMQTDSTHFTLICWYGEWSIVKSIITYTTKQQALEALERFNYGRKLLRDGVTDLAKEDKIMRMRLLKFFEDYN